jgi:hypothetical protein
VKSQFEKENSGDMVMAGARISTQERGMWMSLISIRLVHGEFEASTSRAQRGVEALSSVLANIAEIQDQVEASAEIDR